MDGLRGFAAFSVVLFHFGHWWNFPGLATNSAYALDLFFCLSGYVLPLAYGRDAKPDLSFGRFAAIRLARLMPLIVLATTISASYACLRLVVKSEPGMFLEVAKAVGLGLVSLPDFNAPKAIGGPQLFPLNGPQYTLFLELLISAVWFAMRRLPQGRLALSVFAICMVLLAIFGIGGDTPATFWFGFPRVGASFAGVALFHFGTNMRNATWARRAFGVLCVAMVALFFAPRPVGLPVVLLWIGLVSPSLVLTGAHVPMSGAARKLCLAAGALSYPIYALHYPVFCWVNGGLQMITQRQAPLVEALVVLIGIIAIGAMALYLIDKPASAAFAGYLRRSNHQGGRHELIGAGSNLKMEAGAG